MLMRILTCITLCFITIHSASALTVVDLAGRTVKLDKPATRIILGEGRFIAAIGILDRKNPIKRIVGMLGEFKKFDPAGYAVYAKSFPEIENIPLFGLTSKSSVSVEKAIALKPEVAIFGLSGHGPSARSKPLIDKLEAAGIKTVFIDFRDNPLANTIKSIALLGKVMGRDKEAAEYIEFYKKELAKVTDVVKTIKSKKPTVFLETHVGASNECCRTIARGMISAFIEYVGGANISKKIIPGISGVVNLEYLIAQQPDIYIGTAIGTVAASKKAPTRIVLGADSSPEHAANSLKRAMARPGMATLTAVKNKRVYAIWHHYYNSPLNIIAIQAFAKWIHPEHFKDLDPAETLKTLHSRFQPLPATGKYLIELE